MTDLPSPRVRRGIISSGAMSRTPAGRTGRQPQMSGTSGCTVSVCVPAFTAERFVGETVRSVLAQTFGDFELLVADNHSPDNTAAVARTAAGCDPRVRVIVNDINLGLVGNFNAVVAAARGRYVKILCADDTLMPTLSRGTSASAGLQPRGRTGLQPPSHRRYRGPCAVARLWSPGASTRLRRRSYRDRAMVRVATTPFGEPSTVLFRRDALTAAGPFSDRFESLLDCDLYARLLRLGGVAVVAETLATFRVHPGSLSSRNHHRQASECRRLLRALAADPALGISRLRLWQGLIRTELNALGRRAVFAWGRRRNRHPLPRHDVAVQAIWEGP